MRKMPSEGILGVKSRGIRRWETGKRLMYVVSGGTIAGKRLGEPCRNGGAMIGRALKELAIASVRFYQRWISPSLGSHCRFHPSCSQYMILAIEKYGVVSGVARGLWRICRCHPWSPGGNDPP
ncbi:MAG: membrane protein insertion efficiency factor YidD [Pirellulaceae bacterium]